MRSVLHDQSMYVQVVYNDSKGLVAFVFSLFGRHRLPNKHEQVSPLHMHCDNSVIDQFS